MKRGLLLISGAFILCGIVMLTISLSFGWSDRIKPAMKVKPGIPIVISTSEKAPVQRAVQDLQRDLTNVLGVRSEVVNSLSKAANQPAIVIVGPDSEWKLGQKRWVKGAEAHRVFVEYDGGTPYVIVQGADMRGMIYAIYTFSEKVLGVPPLWYWSSWEPKIKENVELAADADYKYDSPYVQYRSWFANDQSRLSNWRKLSADRDEAWAESMLRLKLNTVVLDNIVSGTQLTKDAQIAKKYGIVAATTHISPLGARIPESPDNKLATIDSMFKRWSDQIDLIRSQQVEVVWTLAFRGHRDVPFWETFHDAPAGDRERAEVIQSMLERQLELLKRKYGNEPFAVRTTLYNEVSDYYAAGLLTLPKNPNLIYNFVAARRDHYPPDGIRDRKFGDQPVGYYLNFQFTSTGSHFAQAEGPWKMEANYRMIGALSNRPLMFAEANMGNFREHLLEGSAFAQMMWSWNTYSTDSYLRSFTEQYFGTESAARAAKLYRSFINSYWNQRNPTIPGFERQFIMQDLSMLKLVQDLFNNKAEETFDNESWYRISPQDNRSRSAFAAIQSGTDASIRKLEQVVEEANNLQTELSGEARPFFNNLIRTQSLFMLGLNQLLHHAVQFRMADNGDAAQAYAHLLAANQGFERLQAALKEQDNGRFATWNSGISGDSAHARLLANIRKAIAERVKKAEDSLNNSAIVMFPGDPGYSEVGKFENSSVKGFDQSATRLAGDSNKGSPVYAQWTPALPKAGYYKVSVWRVKHSDSDPNARIEVKHRDGTTASYINFREGAADWVDVGLFPFEAGSGGYVRNNRNTFEPKTPLRAGAVRFERAGDLQQDISELRAAAVKSNAGVTLAPPYKKSDFHLYLFIGQSNMAGRAPIEDSDRGIVPRAFLLNPDGKWEFAQTGDFGALGHQGFNRYSSVEVPTKRNGLSPAVTFAKTIVDRRSLAGAGIISNAIGDTSITKWQKGAGTGYFEEAVRRTKEAMKDGELKAILWHQGEADVKNDQYLLKLGQMAGDLRAELGVTAEVVPFIAGQLLPGSKYEYFNANTITHIAEHVPNSAYISSEGTTDIGDATHFNSASQRMLGQRYAEKYLEMTKK